MTLNIIIKSVRQLTYTIQYCITLQAYRDASIQTKYKVPLHWNLHHQHKIFIDFVATETNSNAPFSVRRLWQFWCSKRPVSRPTYFFQHQIWSNPVYGCTWIAQSVTATRYGLEGPGIESWWVGDFPHPSRPALGPTQASCTRDSVSLSRG